MFKVPVTLIVDDTKFSNNAKLDHVSADGIVAKWNSLIPCYQITGFVITKAEGGALVVDIDVTPEHAKATVSGAYERQFIKINANNYYFTITAEDGVTTETYRLNIVATKIDTVGIVEIENIVKLYPNPVADYLYFDIQSNTTINQAFIYDFTGKMVKQINQPSGAVNLSNLPTGLYMMRILSSKGEATHKFIKQ